MSTTSSSLHASSSHRQPRQPMRPGPWRKSLKACKARRHSYDASFKLKVVQAALARPPGQRIKPTCRDFPDIEPVQVRKWIRNVEALERALPTTKCIVAHARHNGAASEVPKSPAWETGVALPPSLSRPSAVAFEATPASYEALCSLAIQVAKPISAYGPLPQRTHCSSDSLSRNSMALLQGSKEDGKTVSGLFFPHASAYDAMRRTVMATPMVRGSSEEPAHIGQGARHYVQRSEHAVAMELIHMSCVATPAAS